MFTAQVHSGVELNRLRLNEPQPQELGNHQQMNLHFDTGKNRPDAIPPGQPKKGWSPGDDDAWDYRLERDLDRSGLAPPKDRDGVG